MAETLRLERLTASDLFLLLWDDYGWSTDIRGLAVLDGATLVDDDGCVRVDAIRRHLEARMHLVPRFRQLLYRPRLGLGHLAWRGSASASDFALRPAASIARYRFSAPSWRAPTTASRSS
jgi:hypothetical protein